jgi:hypothetical protein
MPERDEFIRLPLDHRIALFWRGFCCAPHFQCMNQRKVMVLAQRMQTLVAFQRETSTCDTFRSPGIRQG